MKDPRMAWDKENLSLFTGSMTICRCKSPPPKKICVKQLLDGTNKFNKVTGYQDSRQESVEFYILAANSWKVKLRKQFYVH